MGKIKRIKAERKRAEFERKLKKSKTRKNFVLGVLVGVVLIGLFGGGFYGYKYLDSKGKLTFLKSSQTSNLKPQTYAKAPDMQIDANKKYTAKMETSRGTIELELNTRETPKTVNNFVFLSRDGFYDGLKFHRIVKDFMIQGGDPKCSSSTSSESCGQGDAGYKFDDEKFTADYTPGTLAMANSGANTNGSQFFIMHGDYSGGKLPKNYTIFGKVLSGMEVVQKIAETPTEDNGQGEESKPLEEVLINKITIEEK